VSILLPPVIKLSFPDALECAGGRFWPVGVFARFQILL
jgi:hypothetical protein